MAEFLVPVREGKDDFGIATVHVSELAYKPEVIATFRYERGGQEEFLGWAGKVWQALKGPGRKPVDKATFAALQSTKPDPNPFSSGNWSNPFQPDRHPFTRDPRRINPFEGKRLKKEAKKALRLEEIGKAARRLAVMDGIVCLSVDAPQIHVMVNPGKTVHLQVALPDNEGFIEPGQWNAFRGDRMADAEAFAKALAERDGLDILPMSGELHVIFPQPFDGTNDTSAPAVDALGRFVAFAERFAETLPPEFQVKAAVAREIMASGLTSVENAEAAYALIKDAAELLRGVTPSNEAEMIHEATLWVCETAELRYEVVDREWLEQKNMGPGPRL